MDSLWVARTVKVMLINLIEENIQIQYRKNIGKKLFNFFPLQVSTDQQVLVNYDGGSIFAAIDEAVAYSEQCGVKLYIREHPAESRKNEIRKYLLKKQDTHPCLVITDESVYNLIESSQEIITINSTVGLEARINFKKVKFLGRSFYNKATDLQLAKYLNNYLVSVDYHNPIIDKEKHLKLFKLT